MKYVLRTADLTRFQEGLKGMERSGATVEKYGRDLAAFYRWLPPGKEVTRERVLDYKAHLCRRYAPASVNSMLSALRAFFQFAGWKGCEVKLLRIQRRVFISPDRELTRVEYQRLVAAAERKGSRRLSLLLQLLACTGIRASEVRYVTVEAAERGRAEISLKGKIRSILLPGKLCRKLLKYARAQKIASGQIMLTRSGKPLNRKEILAQMKGLCAAAGVAAGKVFPHNLRHLFARTFYRASRDIVQLADLLGHSSVNTTRVYLVSTGQEHRRSLERLGLMWEAGET